MWYTIPLIASPLGPTEAMHNSKEALESSNQVLTLSIAWYAISEERWGKHYKAHLHVKCEQSLELS